MEVKDNNISHLRTCHICACFQFQTSKQVSFYALKRSYANYIGSAWEPVTVGKIQPHWGLWRFHWRRESVPLLVLSCRGTQLRAGSEEELEDCLAFAACLCKLSKTTWWEVSLEHLPSAVSRAGSGSQGTSHCPSQEKGQLGRHRGQPQPQASNTALGTGTG